VDAGQAILNLGKRAAIIEGGNATDGHTNSPTTGPHIDILTHRSGAMTKEAIIAEMKKFTPEERWEIFEAANEPTEEDYELTDEEKKMLDERWKNMQEHPETTISYDELKNRLHAQIQK
jgi:putative addiction module component (TIGR02574 family)